MNSNGNPILALLWTFGLMSLFAVGGANSAIPEMHRVAVDVQHWMSDKEFADLFAISQLSPGPNVLIVTLIGYSVAGIAGARRGVETFHTLRRQFGTSISSCRIPAQPSCRPRSRASGRPPAPGPRATAGPLPLHSAGSPAGTSFVQLRPLRLARVPLRL